MIKTIVGLILLLFPFLLINNFKDKKKGFFYILSFVVGLQLSLAIITQFFGIFSYNTIIFFNFILALFVVYKSDFKKLYKNVKKIRLDLFFILLLLILSVYLYQVHYSYTGEVASVNSEGNQYLNVINKKIPYPYYSDELVSISWIKYSINNGKLPFVNSLWYNEKFPNLLFSLSSFLSQIVLLLDVDPLSNYIIFSFLSGLSICFLVYFILRFNGVDKFSSALSSIFVLYIVPASNIPGVWNLIPITMGVICLLLSFLFITFDDYKMVLYTGFLSLMFYPPLLLFSIFSFIFYLFYSKGISKSKKLKIFIYYIFIAVIIPTIIILYIRLFYIKDNYLLFNFVKEKLFYDAIIGYFIPDFSIYKVLPVFVLFFAAIGVFVVNNKKFWLNATLFIGLIYWTFYSNSIKVFIIGYARAVFVTSIIVVILSGFGINYIISSFNKSSFIRKYKILESIEIFLLLSLFILSLSYTQRDDWEELKLSSYNGAVFYPSPPATNYLKQEDLDFFSSIHNKRFLSESWKGLVIGTATENYPLDSKASTVTNSFFDYPSFVDLNCSDKIDVFEKNEIEYYYGNEIVNCTSFKFINKSQEGFYFYEFD